MLNRAFVFGFDHHATPVAVRERLAALTPHVVGARLTTNAVADEVMVLSTCNRFEVYGLAARPETAHAKLLTLFAEATGHQAEKLSGAAYHKPGAGMVNHGFAVVASLESMVLGEPQILGQMKHAWQTGRELGTVRTYLDRFCTAAFRVGKRVRTETAIGREPASVATAAVRLAEDVHGDLASAAALLVGAGDMCEKASQALRDAGVRHMYVTNRTAERAAALATQVGGNVLPFETMADNLARADVVITSTASPVFVITPEMVAAALRKRKQKPMLIVDIAVPRDADPRVNDVPNAFLYDIDHLGAMVNRAQANRGQAVAQARAIIADEALRFEAWATSHQSADVARALRARFEAARAEVLARKNLSADEATRLLMNKLLHQPLSLARRGDLTADEMELLKRLPDMFGPAPAKE